MIIGNNIYLQRKKQLKTKHKKANLDLIRAIATFCVVVCHSIELSFSLGGFTNFENSKFFSFFFFTIGRFGVPLFLLLTGFLCLSKHIEKDEDVFTFYKHNLIPLLLKCLGWIVVYHLFLTNIMNIELSFFDLLKALFFSVQQPYSPHMWYMPMIIGIYVFIPFMAHIVKSFSFKSISIPLFLSLFVCSVLPAFQLNLSTLVDLSMAGGTYGCMIVLGYYLKTNRLKTKKVADFFLFLFSFLLCYIEHIILNYYGRYFAVWYDNPFLLASAFFLFKWILHFENFSSITTKSVNFISANSQLVFYLHMPILVILNFLSIGKYFSSGYLKFLTLFILTFALSLFVAYVLSIYAILIKKIYSIQKQFYSLKK